MSSFPNVIYGRYGREKESSSTKNTGIQLGTPMILPDGSLFRYCKASAVALVAGKFYQGGAGIQATDADYKVAIQVAASAAAGVTSLTVTAGGTTGVTADQFAGGYLAMAGSAGSAMGYRYAIKSCSSAAAGSTVTLTLEPSDPLKTAVLATTTLVGLRENLYNNILLTTADTVGVSALAGVSAGSAAANTYTWIQRSGPCMVLTDGTLIVGVACCVSDNINGGVEIFTPTAADTIGTRVVKTTVKVGEVMNVAASTAYSLINLMLE